MNPGPLRPFVGRAGFSQHLFIVCCCMAAILSFAVTLTGCGGGGGSVAASAAPSVTPTPPTPPPPPPPPPPPASPPPAVTMSVQGATSVRAGTTSVFTAVLSDGTTAAVQWSVNSVKGGNATIGTIDSSGHYTAPTVLPAPPTVTIGAVQSASPSLSANLAVQLVSAVPTPSISSVNVTQHSGQVTFTISGSNFIQGATAIIHPQGPGILCCADLFGGTLSAAGVITFTPGRAGSQTATSTVIVSVRNPDVNATVSQGFTVSIPFPPPPNLPNVTFDYVAYAVTNLPKHYTDPNSPAGNLAVTDNTPATNPITNAGATLGRVLFYDKLLSANNTTSCGSCHLQQFGFADPNQLSVGFQGFLTTRRSMGLSNAKFYQRGHFFSDERAATLEDQVLQPIENSIEMGNKLSTLIPQMAKTTYYPGLFQAAFGTPDITPDRISLALAQFIRSMVSYQSKFDQAFAAGTNGNPNFAAVFNASELRGQALFTSLGCAQCHTTGGHVSDTIHNVGLDAVTSDIGAGSGKFKAPSLRNVGARVWFMHDGRFEGLFPVIEFYNSGVQNNPDLDPLLRNADGTARKLNMSTQDKTDLFKFLFTLTDNVFLTDPKFASPF
ncbi:MAG TPA: cytochrome c peroxidase [Terriglobales bacterium]